MPCSKAQSSRSAGTSDSGFAYDTGHCSSAMLVGLESMRQLLRIAQRSLESPRASKRQRSIVALGHLGALAHLQTEGLQTLLPSQILGNAACQWIEDAIA